ncbi:hypothetical protein ACFVFQ_07935 [Streptomyces sp. NPDC057743]|uniref:hypothetical protein n=1 Tax=Streptomyces sp. NPDC057743 TaxID=3346236 RepID=UPI003673A223
MPGRNFFSHPEKRLYLGGVALMVLFLTLVFGWLFTAVTAALLATVCLVVDTARRGVSALLARRRRTGWLLLALATVPVSLLGLLVSYAIGLFSGGLYVDKSCRLQQESYDGAYRSQHAAETDRWFPLHNKCNADFDLVPSWVNPALAICATLLTVSIITIIVATVAHLRAPKPRPNS